MIGDIAIGPNRRSQAVGSPNLVPADTDGMVYIPIFTGAPTGVPLNVNGYVPMAWVDNGGSGGYKLYIYSPAAAAWKSLDSATSSGTVSSVAMTAPTALFASPVTGSPVTMTGTLALALATQAKNLVFAGPATGADATPTFRSLVASDVGTGTANTAAFLRGDGVWSNTLLGPLVVGSGTTSSLTFGASSVLTLDSANVLAQRNSTTAQELQVYGTYTDASHFERFVIRTAAGGYTVGAESTGGTLRGLTVTGSSLNFTATSSNANIGTVGANTLALFTTNTTRWNVLSSGHFQPNADATYDIGDGTHQVRSLYVGTSLIFKAANIVTDTTTGTQIFTVGGASGQKGAFWGATPVVQPLLATGAGHSADDIITTLQTLGLCRQA